MYETTESLLLEAKAKTENDPLKAFRDEFHFPPHVNSYGKRVNTTYLCGNSLGLQPKRVREKMDELLSDWATLGVEGHFKGPRPFKTSHRRVAEALGVLCGAKESEVVAMGSLTTNLHLLLASFYKPSGKRTKILMEAGAFPSDQYTIETHLKWHGLNPEEHIVEVAPKKGKRCIEDNDIIDAIISTGDELALVMFAGVQYATGQVFDMERITEAGHSVGAMVGFDLAHAIGNVALDLHDWGVDFAAFCTYKYLNSGPGGIAGIFVHHKHSNKKTTFRLAGWWGYDEPTRFLMRKGFEPMLGAEGWQQSNPPVMLIAALEASLELFMEAGWENVLKKGVELNHYLRKLLSQPEFSEVEIITPKDCGNQLSLVVPKGKRVFEYLIEHGVIGDWREPDIIRVAPAPLYNNFDDVTEFCERLHQGLMAAGVVSQFRTA